MRKAEIKRKTNETDITLALDLDGKGESSIDTGVGFLDHMLTLFARHGCFDLSLKCVGDTCVDDHHTVEDCGIALGMAFRQAIGDKKGINRYGCFVLPMDEALIVAAVDFSGRALLAYTPGRLNEKVGNFDTELIKEFFLAFVRNSEITLHLKRLDGENTHHILEGMFKAAARSLRIAVSTDERLKDMIPSTKGIL